MSSPHRLFPVAFLGLLASAPSLHAKAPDWTQVKPGLTGEEAVQQLGEPLIRTAGAGYEVWIYDGKGEALFAGGQVKAWTVAQPTPESLARPVAQDVLITTKPRFRLPSPSMYRPPVTATAGVAAPLTNETRFRYGR